MISIMVQISKFSGKKRSVFPYTKSIKTINHGDIPDPDRLRVSAIMNTSQKIYDSSMNTARNSPQMFIDWSMQSPDTVCDNKPLETIPNSFNNNSHCIHKIG